MVPGSILLLSIEYTKVNYSPVKWRNCIDIAASLKQDLFSYKKQSAEAIHTLVFFFKM